MSDNLGETLEWYWRVGDDGLPDCGILYQRRPGHAYAVARCPRLQKREQWESDARRLVAAWNACKGIETETLERGGEGWIYPIVENFVEDTATASENVKRMFNCAASNKDRADAATALLEEARAGFERIAALSASGPHVSAKDGMGAALASLDRARGIARAFLDTKPREGKPE